MAKVPPAATPVVGRNSNVLLLLPLVATRFHGWLLGLFEVNQYPLSEDSASTCTGPVMPFTVIVTLVLALLGVPSASNPQVPHPTLSFQAIRQPARMATAIFLARSSVGGEEMEDTYFIFKAAVGDP